MLPRVMDIDQCAFPTTAEQSSGQPQSFLVMLLVPWCLMNDTDAVMDFCCWDTDAEQTSGAYS